MAESTCSVESCESPAYIRGWCTRHYHRWKRHGDPTAGRRSHLDPLPTCSVSGCQMATPRIVDGLCENPYARRRRHNDVGAAELQVIRGRPVDRFWSHVDVEGPLSSYQPDLGNCWIWTLSPDGQGYGQIKVDGVLVLVHRFAYDLLVGPIPVGLTIDHLCMVKMCVRPAHLEPVTRLENSHRAQQAAART